MRTERPCFLIDNDPEDQEIFTMALQEAAPGISCVYASSGSSALAHLKADPAFLPSMIFIDMNMPVMDRRQCLKEIRKLTHLSHVPVYMYSTSADPAVVREVLSYGARDFIEKPSSFLELTTVLRKMIQGFDTLD